MESVEADTVLANKATFNHWQLYLLSNLVICVHRKVLLNDVGFFPPKPTVPYINTCLFYILKCGESAGSDIKFPA